MRESAKFGKPSLPLGVFFSASAEIFYFDLVSKFRYHIDMYLFSHEKIQKIEAWAALLVWMGAIFYLSNQPGLGFGLAPFWEFVLRKIAHMFEYGVLAFLFFRVFSLTDKNRNKNLFWAFVFSVLYALTDEYHQTFIYAREGTLRDVGFDIAGSFISVWLLYLHNRYYELLPKIGYSKESEKEVDQWRV